MGRKRLEREGKGRIITFNVRRRMERGVYRAAVLMIEKRTKPP